MSEAAYKRLKKAIDSGEVMRTGKLPDVYLEEAKIIDPESSDGQTFQAEMERILRNIRPGYFDESGKLLRPVKFVLADTKEENAYIVAPSKNPAVVCLTKGILNICENEDQIAHIIGHEMQHDAFAIENGSGKNSLPEELGCNILPLNWMLEKNGDSYKYNIEAASHFFDRYAYNFGNTAIMQSLAVFDVHGMPSMSAETIHAAVAALQVRHKNLPNETPIPDTIKQLVQNAHHIPCFEKLRLEHPDFDKLSIPERLEMITPALEGFQTGMITRAKGFRDVMGAMNKDLARNDVESKTAATKLIDICVDNNDAFEIAYTPLCRVFFNNEKTSGIKESTPVLGKLKIVEDATSSFVQARTKDEVLAAASQMAKFLEGRPNSKFLEDRSWPNFDIPGNQAARIIAEQEGKGTPWLQHVGWAKEFAEQGNWDVAIALWSLGIAPKELFDIAPVELLEKYSSIAKLGKPKEQYGNLKLAPDGAIVGIQERGNSLQKETSEYVNEAINNKKNGKEIMTQDNQSTKWQQHVLCDVPEHRVTVNIVPVFIHDHMEKSHQEVLEHCLEKQKELVDLATQEHVSFDIYHNDPHPDILHSRPLLVVIVEQNEARDLAWKTHFSNSLREITGEAVQIFSRDEFNEHLKRDESQLREVLHETQNRPGKNFAERFVENGNKPNRGKYG